MNYAEFISAKTWRSRMLKNFPTEIFELTEIYKNLNLVELRRKQRELIEELMMLKEKKNSKMILEELEVYA